MDRASLLKLWDESWKDGIWIAPWSKAVADLTPRQAAWRPKKGRHSIWQNVVHVCFWREYTLMKLAGKPPLTREQIIAAEFAEPKSPTAAEWRKTVRRLKKSHDDMRRAIARPRGSLARLQYHLPHDCYHLGQIMYLRALQGFKKVV